MNDEQERTLFATLEALARAVQFLAAERIRTLPASDQEAYVAALLKAMTDARTPREPLSDAAAELYADVSVRQRAIAERLIAGARQLSSQEQPGTARPQDEKPARRH